jgi:hypothetical protein
MDLSQLAQTANYAAQAARNAEALSKRQDEELRRFYAQQAREMKALQDALSRVQIQTRVGDPNIQRVENIPGRRVPFDFLVDIPIQTGETGTVQGTITIDQTGPFVAVGRYAAFVSTYGFTYTDPDTEVISRFNGRSYGRYRPIHSVFDLNDGQPYSNVTYAQAFPGTGAPHFASPANASPFRSMEMDFRIEVREAGSSMPRSNQPVPSAFWMKAINDPWQLGALDFFERNEVITFNVAPTHAPNQSFGNISGFGVPANFPFIDSQWDAIEGINDQAQAISGDTDPVVRAPSGVLTIGFFGYRIWQPPGAGQY